MYFIIFVCQSLGVSVTTNNFDNPPSGSNTMETGKEMRNPVP